MESTHCHAAANLWSKPRPATVLAIIAILAPGVARGPQLCGCQTKTRWLLGSASERTMHRRDNYKLTLTMTRTGPSVHGHWPGFFYGRGSRHRGSLGHLPGVVWNGSLDASVAIAVLDLTDFNMKDPRFLNLVFCTFSGPHLKPGPPSIATPARLETQTRARHTDRPINRVHKRTQELTWSSLLGSRRGTLHNRWIASISSHLSGAPLDF